MTASGALTFTAGTPVVLSPSRITRITRASTTTTVYFTTTNGSNYRLLYSTNVAAASNSWAQLSGTIAGNNATNSLTDVTNDVRRFYKVQTY
jgi:hypothetical protein